jgi:hypothetical protein
MPEFVKIAKTTDIAPGEAKAVDLGAKRIAIFNIEGTYHAIDDKCTYRGGPLSEGMVVGTEVTCPWPLARRRIRRDDRKGTRAAGVTKCGQLPGSSRLNCVRDRTPDGESRSHHLHRRWHR